MNSPSEAVTLTLKRDGNLVLSCGSSQLWSSNTEGNRDIKSLDFQGNGNLVLIHKDNSIAWSTKVQNSKGNHFTVQNNGKLVLFDSNNEPVWTSNAVGSCYTASKSQSQIFSNLQIFYGL